MKQLTKENKQALPAKIKKEKGKNMLRENFKSRLGFLLVSAGCAIGIGNVWRFPYVTGQNGGSIFVLFYLLFLVIMGLPVMTMEYAVGRAGKSTAMRAFQALEPKKSPWHIHGIVCMIGCYILMMYYTTVSGWMVGYFWKFLTGTFDSITTTEEVSAVFGNLVSSPSELILWLAITVVCGFVVLCFGLQKGLEKVNKIVMSCLLVLIIVLAVRSILLPGGGEGLKFYLVPNWEAVQNVGLFNVITAAMNQAFFTLSLGIGSMEIFGSYMSRDYSLTGESIRVIILDTFVAICSGLIIFPACFAYGVQPDAGPNLIFQTLPNVFINMNSGRIWGTLFFLFMTFASFSTVIAVFEALIASCTDNFGWSRKKAIIINIFFVLVASLPCVFSFNIWSDITICGLGIMDLEDFIVSNLLLPIGALVYLLFCVSKWGWKYDNYLEEVNTGKGIKLSKSKLIKWYLQYVLPLLILVILISGLL